jgi:hypothetical protein
MAVPVFSIIVACAMLMQLGIAVYVLQKYDSNLRVKFLAMVLAGFI